MLVSTEHRSSSSIRLKFTSLELRYHCYYSINSNISQAMRHHFSRFISQTLNHLPKPITLSPRSRTPLRGPNFIRQFSNTAEKPKFAPSKQVAEIVDELAGLTLLEISDLAEVLRKKMGIEEMPMMVIMMPGMGPAMAGTKGKGGGGVAKQEEKKERTSFDLKLEGGFDAAGKLKIIKEVRAVTDLGLKEAKDLVEKAPTLLKKGVAKDEAVKIIAKLKEVGAKVILE